MFAATLITAMTTVSTFASDGIIINNAMGIIINNVMGIIINNALGIIINN